MLDSLKSLSMLCARVRRPCPVPVQRGGQTWKNITRCLTSIAKFTEKKPGTLSEEKTRLDFPSEASIKY